MRPPFGLVLAVAVGDRPFAGRDAKPTLILGAFARPKQVVRPVSVGLGYASLLVPHDGSQAVAAMVAVPPAQPVKARLADIRAIADVGER